ncbi:Hpt domain-containing protein [Desulfocastanea catecholica]
MSSACFQTFLLATCKPQGRHYHSLSSRLSAFFCPLKQRRSNIDAGLVNKVFYAAHSIKGDGAGFMALTTIEDLSRAAETVLGMIRSKKLLPTPEPINVLLIAADQLQRLLEDVQNSNAVDISSHLTPLNAIAIAHFLRRPVRSSRNRKQNPMQCQVLPQR